MGRVGTLASLTFSPCRTLMMQYSAAQCCTSLARRCSGGFMNGFTCFQFYSFVPAVWRCPTMGFTLRCRTVPAVCARVHVCVYVSACMYSRASVRRRVCAPARTHAHARSGVRAHTHASMHARMNPHTRTHSHSHMRMQCDELHHSADRLRLLRHPIPVLGGAPRRAFRGVGREG